MGKVLAIAFMRGVGGGLSLAAVPYILAGATVAFTAGAGAARYMVKRTRDAADAVRYWRELRESGKWEIEP